MLAFIGWFNESSDANPLSDPSVRRSCAHIAEPFGPNGDLDAFLVPDTEIEEYIGTAAPSAALAYTLLHRNDLTDKLDFVAGSRKHRIEILGVNDGKRADIDMHRRRFRRRSDCRRHRNRNVPAGPEIRATHTAASLVALS
jgi:hypothetical protein